MQSKITIKCLNEELQMFYIPLTIEPQNKITLLAADDIDIKTGEKMLIDLKVELDSDIPILIYPNNSLNDTPLISVNLSNVYDNDNSLSLFNNPNRETYKEFVNAGIDSFKTDILKQLTKKRSNDIIINKILDKVKDQRITKGTPLFDIYLSNFQPFTVELK
tara:strand:- start:1236 stop:1721 length:486 start_codon:yes stop_codon:yes gene_type:complete